MHILCILFSLNAYWQLLSFPIGFKRDIKLQNGVVVKTVDFIYDAHKPFREVVNKASRNSPLLKDVERKLFTTSERTLLITLRQLNKQSEEVGIFWEFYSRPVKDAIKNSLFLLYGGDIVKEEFDGKGSLHFKNVDSYRRSMDPLFSGIAFNPPSSHYLLKNFKNSFSDFLYSRPLKDLVMIKEHNVAIYEIAKKLWKSYVQQVEKDIFEGMIDPALHKNPGATFQDFKNDLSEEQKNIFTHLVTFNVMDYEVLFAIISASLSHIVVFAGAGHCRNVSKLLEEHFGYVSVIDMVSDFGEFGGDVYYSLVPRTWNFLLEAPSTSLTRYKQHRKTLSLPFPELQLQFPAIFSTLSTLVRGEEDYLEKTLTPFFEKAGKSYIDYINVRNKSNETLLFPVVRNNNIQITKYFIKHGARLNVQNEELKTPLHYAAELPTSDMFILLLKNGADMNIKDVRGKTAFDYVSHQWQSQLSEILKGKTEKTDRALRASLMQLSKQLQYLANN